MKCAKPKTKKLLENKFKGIKITDIGKQNEEQKKRDWETHSTGLLLLGHVSKN